MHGLSSRREDFRLGAVRAIDFEQFQHLCPGIQCRMPDTRFRGCDLRSQINLEFALDLAPVLTSTGPYLHLRIGAVCPLRGTVWREACCFGAR
jgi:hypothetical protein